VLVDLDSSDPRPVYRQIVDEIRRCVSVGILKIDEPLPAVRKLAGELKVNANTVQQAYRTLEHEGDVYVKRGLGTFISARAKEAGRGRSAAVARQIASRMLREGFRHGLLASDLIAALQEIAPKGREKGERPREKEESGSR
jgi:GntR family transcriptional regulator